MSVAVLMLLRTCMETTNPNSTPRIPPTPVLPPTHIHSREVQKLQQPVMWVESAALNKCLQAILNTDLLKSRLFLPNAIHESPVPCPPCHQAQWPSGDGCALSTSTVSAHRAAPWLLVHNTSRVIEQLNLLVICKEWRVSLLSSL